MSEREKYNALLKAIKEIHEKGRPILIGTESVEVSEKLSRILKQNKLEHNVLNAKQHEREAEIIAHAGKKGAITIATNMAGRGTDIKLEAGVAELGGLHVIGSTRHQSRRIDRQLRGRCARQGDPGTSLFYISFEDPLLRMFTSPKITGLLQRLRPPEGEPISASVLNRSIETAQKRIEQRNYNMRKHTLEYDDVMNKQRQTIYAFRNEILHTEDSRALVIELLETVCANAAEEFFQNRNSGEGWNPEGYRQWLMHHFPVSFEEGFFNQDLLDLPEIEKMASDRVIAAFQEKIQREESKIAPEHLPKKGFASDGAIRHMMIRRIDRLWQEHLLKMDHLRTDVNLRSVGQRDPLTEFKHEAFSLFDQFSRTVRTEIAQDLFRFEIKVRPIELSMQEMLSSLQLETTRSFLPELEGQRPQQPPPQQPQQQPPAMAASALSMRKTPVIPIPQNDREEESSEIHIKAGRNELCPCGSGKKFKKCCSTQAE